MAQPISTPQEIPGALQPARKAASAIRRWIAAHGGLTPRMLFLRGKQLQALYKPCYLDAQASANRPGSR